MEGQVRIMIVDDHVVVREGLKQILELEPDFRVIGQAGDGQECLEMVGALAPDIVFMDLKMPRLNGIQTTRKLVQGRPGVKVVMLTVYDDQQYVTQAIQAGARGYVLKNAKRAELIEVVRGVLSDQPFLDPKLTAGLFASIQQADGGEGPANLTKRELEVLDCLVRGMSDRQIAESLFISEHTSRTHVKKIYRKLGVSSRAQAAVKALKLKLVEKEPE